MNKKYLLTFGIFLLILILSAIMFITKDSEHTTDKNKEKILEELMALPYLKFVKEDESSKKRRGVIFYDKELSYQGLNLYNNHLALPSGAYLINMRGEILHKWVYREKADTVWRFMEIEPDGSIIALLRETSPGLIKLDWNSKLQFALDGHFHHDVAIAEDGTIYALLDERKEITYDGHQFQIRYPYISVISQGGITEMNIDLYKLFLKENKFLNDVLKEAAREKINFLEPFHMNTIEILDKEIEGVSKKGDFLVCVRNIDLIAIVDRSGEKILWSWGQGDLDKPHEPTLLDNGNILIFDNGKKRKYSRIIELNPKSKQIIWEYSKYNKSFFTSDRGGNQQLPNGNILITESDKGRVFEITREGKIVWEWYNPHFNEEKDRRAVLYRMVRLDKNLFDNLISDGFR